MKNTNINAIKAIPDITTTTIVTLWDKSSVCKSDVAFEIVDVLDEDNAALEYAEPSSGTLELKGLARSLWGNCDNRLSKDVNIFKLETTLIFKIRRICEPQQKKRVVVL